MPKENIKEVAVSLPPGEIFEDLFKKKWMLGDAIAQGGFGAIYAIKDADSEDPDYPYVIKVEPFTSGPLFVEKKFYIMHLKSNDVEDFLKKKNLKIFGVPLFITAGSHEYQNKKFRFLIIEKLGRELRKIFEENNKIFPTSTVFKIAIQLLDILEYIHERGYIHADIKAGNILMGLSKETKDSQVFLVDFGLCTKFTKEQKFVPNLKRAHDGTLEYLSRDAHLGVPTRRGDLEILAYNLIEWLGCTLPWKKQKNKNTVQQMKENKMSDTAKFIKECFGTKTPPGALLKYLEYLKTLTFDEAPDYKMVKDIFMLGVSKNDSLDKPLQFSPIEEIIVDTPTKAKRKLNNANKNAEANGNGAEKAKGKGQKQTVLQMKKEGKNDGKKSTTSDSPVKKTKLAAKKRS